MDTPLISDEPALNHSLRQALVELEDRLVQWQSALVGGRLREFQNCTAEQRRLSRKFEKLISTPQPPAPNVTSLNSEDLVLYTARIREQVRVFFATLRRLARILETRQRALQGCARLYTQPNATQPGTAV